MAIYYSTPNCKTLTGGNTNIASLLEDCDSSITYDDNVYIMNGNAITGVTLSACGAGNQITSIVANTFVYPDPAAYTFVAAEKDGIKLSNDKKTEIGTGSTTVENELALKMVKGVDSEAARCFSAKLQDGGNYVFFTEKCGQLYMVLAAPKCGGVQAFSGLKVTGNASESTQESNMRAFKFSATNKNVEQYPLDNATSLVVRTWITEGNTL